MADKSPIEWTEATWNPVVGCSILSPGCTNCYAMRMAARIEAMAAGAGRPTHYAGTTRPSKAGPVWTGKMALAPSEILLQPLRWKRPRMIFVNSMSDLFHESVPDEWIDQVFAIMALAPQHTFQVLTKRASRMGEYINGQKFSVPMLGAMPLERVHLEAVAHMDGDGGFWDELKQADGNVYSLYCSVPWPLPNVWLGVSTERQQEADERVPDLLATPAAIRFVSAEPLLGPIDFYKTSAVMPSERHPWRNGPILQGIHWLIAGGESGPGARPMHPEWARMLRDQCAAADVAFFFKQWGEWSIGEEVRNAGVPRFWRFPDGDEFHIMSDGQDIIMAVAQDSTTPRHIWNGYWADGHGNLAKKLGKKRAGRLLDGREHNDMPGRAA